MVTPCPTPDVLQQYFLGTDLGPRTDSVEGHLATCPRCVEALQALHGDDPLVSALRSQGTARRLNNPVVEGLRLRLRQLSFTGSSASGTLLTNGLETTTPPVLPAGLPFPVNFLAPPRTPGEMGRLDEYRVLDVLGRGGMGVVFRAEDEKLQRPIALKVMHPDLAASAAARDRFLREARLVAALTHEHIVTVYRAGEDRGVLFLAMPLLKGESLEDRLRRGTPPLGEALRIARETAEGLAAAHEQGLIHRDIKPANLFLEGTKVKVKILDFGLARPVESDGQLTQPGVVVGTPAYMAPEQIGGQAEQRSDLFSLGCVLYRMVTGRTPFPGRTTVEIFPQTLLGRFRPVAELMPSVPAPVADVIHKLLAVDPAARPVSAVVVAVILKTLEARCADVPAPAPAPAPAPVPAEVSGVTLVDQSTKVLPLPWWRQKRLLIAASAAGVLLAGLIGLAIALRSGDKGKEVAARDPDRKKDDEESKSDQPKDPPKKEPKDNPKKEPKDNPEPKPEEPPDPPPGQPRPTGKPLSDTALVGLPERVRGVDAWDLEIDRRNWRRLSALEFGTDGKLLMTEETSGGRYQFDFVRAAFTVLPKPEGKNDGFVWSPDRKTRAKIAGLEVQLLDAEGDRVRRTLGGPVKNAIVVVSWSPNGQFLVGVEKQNQIWIWEPKEGARHNLSLTFDTDGSTENCRFHWAGDSRTLVLQPSSYAYLIDVEQRLTFTGISCSQSAVCWANDFRAVALTGFAGSSYRFTHVHVLPDGKKVKQDRVNAPAAWSPKGSPLASPALDGTVELIDTHTWKVDAKLKCREPVQHVAFSPDGKTLAAVTEDKRVLFWDVKEARLIGTFVLLSDGRWFAWGAEGHYRGSDGVEKLVRLQYTVRPEKGAVSDLTPAEFGEQFGWKNDPDRVRLRVR